MCELASSIHAIGTRAPRVLLKSPRRRLCHLAARFSQLSHRRHTTAYSNSDTSCILGKILRNLRSLEQGLVALCLSWISINFRLVWALRSRTASRQRTSDRPGPNRIYDRWYGRVPNLPNFRQCTDTKAQRIHRPHEGSDRRRPSRIAVPLRV